MTIREALTFDDVSLVPAFSQVVPSLVDTRTRLTRSIDLGVPLLSAAMDTVTEAPMAIAMAQNGGLGIVHKNMTPERQADEVRRVKKFESGMVVNPLTIGPDEPLSAALDLMASHRISGVPVVEAPGGRLAGILTHRDVRFATDRRQPVRELMTRENLVTVSEGVSRDEARRLLHRHRIEKLLVVDEAGRCVGLITGQGHGEGQSPPRRDQGREGPAALRGRHRGRRGGIAARRGADRRRGGCRRGRYRPRPQRRRGRSGRRHQEAVELHPGDRGQHRHRRSGGWP